MRQKILFAQFNITPQSAWQKFYSDYNRHILKKIHYYFYNSRIEDREDIYQEVYYRLINNDFKTLTRFTGDSKYAFLSYLNKIILTTGTSYIRYHSRIKKNQFIIESGNLENMPDNRCDIIKSIILKETINEIKSIINILSHPMRKVADLFFIQQYTPVEIAEQLTISSNAVYIKLYRIKKELLKKFCF